jgi:hypothetical protein
MCEKTRKGGIVGTTCGVGFTCTWKPFEEKYQGTKRLKRSKLGRIEGIKIIYDKRYTEGFQELAGAQARSVS